MAEMIPDRLPDGSSVGEKKVFAILQGLPEDYIVYYEPVIANRYPDFIVIAPDMGLLIIEVKGWYPKHIKAADSHEILIEVPGKRPEKQKHPLRQAREYMYLLMDRCREHKFGHKLLNKSGDNQNKFIFPFGNFAILSNITAEQLKKTCGGDLPDIFPESKVVTRDLLEQWVEESLEGEVLATKLRSYFDPFWTIKRLNDSQVDALRAIIHPQVLIEDRMPALRSDTIARSSDLQSESIAVKVDISTTDLIDIKTLDLRQEKHAHKLGDGHRILYGVAGSGKTTILIARAKILSENKPHSRILFLCYNVTLAAYLKKILASCLNVKVQHFDGWAKSNGIVRGNGETNESIGSRLLRALESGREDTESYDAVLVDEAQDFYHSWFKCALAAMKDPDNGDLIIVSDGSQGIYSGSKISWKDLGINAQGRTIYKNFDLDKNYRNPREVVELARLFASKSDDTENEDMILSIYVDPSKCLRSTGIKPVFMQSSSHEGELDRVEATVQRLLSGDWFGRTIDPLDPKEIGILYPWANKSDKSLLDALLTRLRRIAPAIWLNNSREARHRSAADGIKVQTIHSSKGLQYRAVILMWMDGLPMPFGDMDELADRRLLYVGMTRPTDFLAISASGSSKFMDEVLASGGVDIV